MSGKHYYTDEKNAQIVIALLKAHGAACRIRLVHGVWPHSVQNDIGPDALAFEYNMEVESNTTCSLNSSMMGI